MQQQPTPTREPGEVHRPGYAGLVPVIIAVTAFVFVVLPGIFMIATPHPHGTRYDDPPLVEDFELARTDGSAFRLSELRGKVVVVYFGYTSCPDVCPATLYDLRRALEQLGDQAQDVEVVFITIDPAVDTPEKIEQYLGYFNPTFIGLTGTPEQLRTAQDIFGVRVLRADEGQTIPGYAITHTTSMFVIDREGYLKLRMHHQTDVELLARDLRYVIRGRL